MNKATRNRIKAIELELESLDKEKAALTHRYESVEDCDLDLAYEVEMERLDREIYNLEQEAATIEDQAFYDEHINWGRI
jgi:hypothetical protein